MLLKILKLQQIITEVSFHRLAALKMFYHLLTRGLADIDKIVIHVHSYIMYNTYFMYPELNF